MTSTFSLSGSSAGSAKSVLRSVQLRGPAGRLEALLNEGSPDARYTALVCHPHPLGGGSLHNKVVYHAMKVLNAPEWGMELPVLRFNFRGTGLSEGRHDGNAESGDVVAALDWLENEYKRAVVVVGFSFGAAMALRGCCGLSSKETSGARLRALIALGLPTEGFGEHFHYPFLSACILPKLFLSGDRDEYAPSHDLRQAVEEAAEPKKLVLIQGADHFFSGQLEIMQNALAGWLKEQVQ